MRNPSSVRLVALFVLSLATAMCGLPTEPGTVDVEGQWAGTWQFVAAGATVTDDVTMTLRQNGVAGSGTWIAQSGASGQLNFNAMGAASGTMTINQATLGGSSCNATTTITGSLSDSHIEFTIADIPSGGICQWGTNSRFVVDKQ